MPKIGFEFEGRSLEMETGVDEIAWSYKLNTANYPTYGGEVIQILSIYIDDISMAGTVATYRKLEEIYNYFAKYMTLASQGPSGTGSYNQGFMKMTYEHRNWTLYIQPLSIPGFVYSTEVVAPEWHLTAHVVDKTSGNYQALRELTEGHILNNSDFKLQGIISPAARNPANNPWSAPGVVKNSEFSPATKAQTSGSLKQGADYYNSLIQAYEQGEFSSIHGNIGSKPAFGRTSGQEDQTSSQQVISNAEAEAIKRLEEGQKNG